jgi:hypothetical protein
LYAFAAHLLEDLGAGSKISAYISVFFQVKVREFQTTFFILYAFAAHLLDDLGAGVEVSVHPVPKAKQLLFLGLHTGNESRDVLHLKRWGGNKAQK